MDFAGKLKALTNLSSEQISALMKDASFSDYLSLSDAMADNNMDEINSILSKYDQQIHVAEEMINEHTFNVQIAGDDASVFERYLTNNNIQYNKDNDNYFHVSYTNDGDRKKLDKLATSLSSKKESTVMRKKKETVKENIVSFVNLPNLIRMKELAGIKDDDGEVDAENILPDVASSQEIPADSVDLSMVDEIPSSNSVEDQIEILKNIIWNSKVNELENIRILLQDLQSCLPATSIVDPDITMEGVDYSTHVPGVSRFADIETELKKVCDHYERMKNSENNVNSKQYMEQVKMLKSSLEAMLSRIV